MSLKNVINKSNTYELGIAQMLVTRSLTQFHNQILKSYGLSSVEWFVLGMAYERAGKGIRITDLAVIFGVKTTYITAIVNGLRQKKYVTSKSDPSDARVRLVVATAKGREQVPVIEKRLKTEAEQLYKDRITAEQLDNYFKVVQTMGNQH